MKSGNFVDYMDHPVVECANGQSRPCKYLNLKKHHEIRPSEARIEVYDDIRVDDLINVDYLFWRCGSSVVSKISILFHPAKRQPSSWICAFTEIEDVLLPIFLRDYALCVLIIT